MSSVASRGGWKRYIYVQEIAMFSSIRTILEWKKYLSALNHILNISFVFDATIFKYTWD